MLNLRFYREEIKESEIKENITEHVWLNHTNLTHEAVVKRFRKNITPDWFNMAKACDPDIISEWYDEETAIRKICALLKVCRPKFEVFLKNWNKKEDGLYLVFCGASKTPVGEYICKKGDWKQRFQASNFRVVLKLVNADYALRDNISGWEIYTAYPLPNKDEMLVSDKECAIYRKARKKMKG